jgi:hypothetical protein
VEELGMQQCFKELLNKLGHSWNVQEKRQWPMTFDGSVLITFRPPGAVVHVMQGPSKYDLLGCMWDMLLKHII